MSVPAEGSGRSKGLSLEEVSHLIGGRVEGARGLRVHDVVPIQEAGPGQLGFLSRRTYVRFIGESGAESLLVGEKLVSELPPTRPSLVIVPDPALALAQLLDVFHPDPEVVPDIHPTAVLGRNVKLGQNVSIGPYAVVEADTTIGDGARLGAHVVIGRSSRVGEECILHPHVVLYANSVLGRRVILHSGTRIGVDGFGYVPHEGEHRKVRQVGGCTVDDDVEIGANSCVDRGSIGSTRIGAGTKIDNLVHVGHNVDVGRAVLLVAQVGVSGSTRIGDGAVMGGQAGAAGHLDIGEGARVAGQAGVIGDIPARATVMGFPARPQREFLRATGTLFRLPDLLQKMRRVETRNQEEDSSTESP